jgi:DNA-binding CsgD family transcriptional regulator
MIEAGLEKYHRSSFLLAISMMPIVFIIVVEQNFSLDSFALLGIDAVIAVFHAVRWRLYPGKSRFSLYASIAVNSALPSLCLFSYSVMTHSWAAGLEHPLLILYAVVISFALFLKEARFVYASTAIAVGGYLGLLGFAAFTGRLRLGAAYLGAWGRGYLDIASPIFIVSILAFYGAVLGYGMKAVENPRTPPEKKRPIDLSPREEEIALLIAEGLEHKEIAQKLDISVSTVKNHVKKIYAKQGARNKIELINTFRGGEGTAKDS